MIIITIIYLIILAVISTMVVWNMFTTKKLTDKIIGAIMLILLVLRLLLIK